jgi:L-amino acid N-acyltransferase YncA
MKLMRSAAAAAAERKAQRKVDAQLIALEKEMLELHESGGFERVGLADDVARDPVKFGEWMLADFARREAAAAALAAGGAGGAGGAGSASAAGADKK